MLSDDPMLGEDAVTMAVHEIWNREGDHDRLLKGAGITKFALNIEKEETEVGAVAPGHP